MRRDVFPVDVDGAEAAEFFGALVCHRVGRVAEDHAYLPEVHLALAVYAGLVARVAAAAGVVLRRLRRVVDAADPLRHRLRPAVPVEVARVPVAEAVEALELVDQHGEPAALGGPELRPLFDLVRL